MHNHSVNCNHVPPAIIYPVAAITTPRVVTVACLGCPKTIDYIGEAGVAFCDGCLAILSGDEEVVVSPSRRRVDEEADVIELKDDELTQDTQDDVTDDVATVPDKHAHEDVVVDEVTSCATCTDSTAYTCRCGRRACIGCIDEETGLCPQCE